MSLYMSPYGKQRVLQVDYGLPSSPRRTGAKLAIGHVMFRAVALCLPQWTVAQGNICKGAFKYVVACCYAATIIKL